MRIVVRSLLLFLAVSLLLTFPAQAQYFGRNKVQWERFDFKTLQTEHFDIYYYDREADVVQDIGRMAERWYARLSRTFNHSFTRKPIVLYANAADFQQTTTTGELIGEGTGGFTDEFMNRVVLPLTGDYAENDHVLGHEMVHVFQYDIAATGGGLSGGNSAANNRRRFSLEMLPLWIVEGMAEYFSKGRLDPLTAMWIRDATIHNRMPDYKKLNRDPRYFPYRYGQALLAYIGGRFGDDAVVRYFLAAGLVGPDNAADRALGISTQQLFTDWQESARELYNPIVADRPASTLGAPLIGTPKGHRGLNIGPALSPDGQYLAYLSTRDIFDIDLWLADAKTGNVIRKLVSSDRDAHFEALRFIESAGSWSPDSRRLAYIVFAKGDNYLGLVDVNSRRTDAVHIPGVDAINNVSWSPDGHTIAISGQQTGTSDLFLYDVDSKQVRRLTNDKYADLQPTWSPDGRTIAFVSDRGAGTVLEQLRYSDMRISTIDVGTGAIRTLPLFDGAKHINPQYAPDGNSLYFIANPEGIPDVYRFAFSDGHIERLTHVQTGVAGITEMSPALSVAARTGDIAFSIFEDDNYNIYRLNNTTAAPVVVNGATGTSAAQVARGAQLPPLRGTGSTITSYLQDPAAGLPPTTTTFRTTGYNSGLHLAYLGPPTIGVTAGGFGSGVGGSVSAYFTDILGEQNVGITFQGGGSSGYGTFADQLAGEIFYLNQQHRWNWGADYVHSPYITGGLASGQTLVNIDGQVYQADVLQQEIDIIRYDDLSLIGQYPFSQTRRIEGSVGAQRQSEKLTLDTIVAVGDTIIDETRESLGGYSLNLGHAGAAFVGDSSTFGFISPIRGTRYRYEVTALRGDLNFQTALADWRKYWFFRPITVAVRGLHYGRYGKDAENNQLYPLYVAQNDLVRGYDISNISNAECGTGTNGGACPVADRLFGSRLVTGSAEVRVPLFGTKEFGLSSAFIPTELMAFVDAGAAWYHDDKVKWNFSTNTNERVPVVSAGIGARILLSYIPLEFYYAKPFQRPGAGWVFGFNILPGW